MTTSPATVPYSKLAAIDEINARGKTKEGIDELAASIAARGLIQPLAVRPGDGDKYEVIDGRRRLLALAKLVKDGTLKKTYPVPVLVRNETDSEALETSLIANTQRLPMHQVEQHEVIKRLVDQGVDEGEIAARFGITLRTVRQHLALGAMAPTVRAAWKAEKIDAETAKEFAKHPDQSVQADLYERLRKHHGGRFGAFHVRAALSKSRVLAKECEELAFVGEKAYRVAGGKLSESLFDDDNYVEDLPLVEKLARDKLELEAARLRGNGWSWATVKFASNGGGSWAFDLVDEEAPFEAPEDYFSAEQRARSGCLVSLGHKGALSIEYGLVKRDAGDEGTVNDDDGLEEDESLPSAPADAEDTDAGDEVKISAALMRTVSESLTAATAATLAVEPLVALRATIAGLMATGHSQPVKLTANGWPASTAPRSATQFDAMFDALDGATLDELLSRLARLVAGALDMRNFNGGQPNKHDVALIAALDGATFSSEARAAFNAIDYFTRAAKPVALAAIEEMREAGAGVGMAPNDVLADMKKSEIAKAAAESAIAAGWVPRELRHPQFTFASPVKVAAE